MIPFDQIYEMIPREQPMEYYRSLYDYMSLLPPCSTIMEIGCYRGNSTLTMAAAIQGTGSHIIAVDPIFLTGSFYEDNPQPRYYQTSLSDFFALVRKACVDGYISIVPEKSEDLFDRWDDRELDFLFIDGAHQREAVLRDCRWMQYVKRGGYAAFDDWFYGEVGNAVTEYLNDHPGWTCLHRNTEPVDQKDPSIHWDVTIFRKDL